MQIVILIPAVICILALIWSSPQRAFLNVYLPVFMLLPVYFSWKVAALPPIDFAEAVLVPIGIVMIFTDLPRWHFTRTDLWIVLFIFSTWYADHAAQKDSIATFALFAGLSRALVPYMIGKLLIEQYNARTETVKRIVFLLFVSAIVSAYEYRMGRNPFSIVFAPLFPDEHFAWKTQIRWGFGRVSGPFAQSELAGIVFAFGLILALYLGYFGLWERKFKHLEWLPLTKSTVITATLAASLLMTQARGPWLGALIALPIAFIGRTRFVLRRAIFIAALGIACGTVGYLGLKYYTAGPTTSEEQETAQYRQQLVSNYTPVVKQGGLFGWGQDFPSVGTQGSIDNEYLYVALTQGYLGLAMLVLLSFEALLAIVKLAFLGGDARDRYFGFSLLGIMIGLLAIVGTVFLGLQPYQMFFLLVGWSQSLRYSLAKIKAPEPTFEAVYT